MALPTPFALALVLAAPITAPILPAGAVAHGERDVRRDSASAGQNSGDTGSRWLLATSDGGFLYDDPGHRFKAYVGPDGSVVFARRWKRPSRRPTKRRRQRCCGAPPGGLAPAVNMFSGAPASGPTEWIFRARGRDPSVAAKAEFLSRTAVLRIRLAKEAARAQMRTALDALDSDLARLWADSALSPSRKRTIVFERWDGLADARATHSADADLDALRAVYAGRARRRIEAFVRRELPQHSVARFPAPELARLNAARNGSAVFAPYARSAD